MASVNSTSSSSSSSSSSTVQNGRYWGLASGLDVDSIVTALVSKQQSKIDKAQQQQQKLEWKQEAYRDIITKLNNFETAYLKLGSSTSMATTNMYTSYTSTSTNPLLTVSANSDADGVAQTVTIKQSATIATLTGSSVSGNLKSSYSISNAISNLKDFASMAETLGNADPSMTITVDGVAKTISFSSADLNSVTDESSFIDLVNSKLTAAFGQVPATGGSGNVTKVVATNNNGYLEFSTAGGYQTQFTLSASTSTFDARMLGTLATVAERNSADAPKMQVTYGGVTQTLTFTTSDDLSQSGYLATINSKLAAAFPDKGLVATVDSKGAITIKDSGGKAATYTTSNTSYNALDAIGFKSGDNNRLNVNTTTLGQLLQSKGFTPGTGNITATINGVSVTLGTADTKLSDVFQNINKSGAGVTIAYNKTLDSVSLTANQSGAAGSIDISSDTSNLFAALGITATSATGRDAIVNINGVDYTRDSNNFSINGVTYGITAKVDPAASGQTSPQSTVTFTANTSTLKKGLQDFISAYNTLVDAIHTQINTAPDNDYQPLTDSQKSQMSETQIDKWNEKAKAGMLFGDSTLESIADQMRDMLYRSVTLSDGSTYSLYDIGITTSNYADDYGKLEIKLEDESKFEEAIAKNADKIAQLFTKSSSILLDINPQTDAERAQQTLRKQEEGLAARLDDIIKAYAGTVSGNKGSLLTIAGMVGDSTQYNNNIYTQLKDINQTITDLKSRLKTEKERYYEQFEKLETYMEQANSQASTLSSLFGSK